jgi:hypothetical protein
LICENNETDGNQATTEVSASTVGAQREDQTLTSSPLIEQQEKECVHGHKARKVGCVACVFVFDPRRRS